jgi:hypothetical protein
MPTMTNTLEISDENNPHLQFEKWKLSPLERSGGRVALEIAFMDLNPQRMNQRKVSFVEFYSIKRQSVIFNSLSGSNLTTNKLLLLVKDIIFMDGLPADGTTG